MYRPNYVIYQFKINFWKLKKKYLWPIIKIFTELNTSIAPSLKYVLILVGLYWRSRVKFVLQHVSSHTILDLRKIPTKLKCLNKIYENSVITIIVLPFFTKYFLLFSKQTEN